MNESLVRAILDVAVFLEFADDETVDPDAAVGAMEQLSATLQGMSLGDQAAFAIAVRRLSSRYESVEIAAFVSDLPDALGLAESKRAG